MALIPRLRSHALYQLSKMGGAELTFERLIQRLTISEDGTRPGYRWLWNNPPSSRSLNGITLVPRCSETVDSGARDLVALHCRYHSSHRLSRCSFVARSSSRPDSRSSRPRCRIRPDHLHCPLGRLHTLLHRCTDRLASSYHSVSHCDSRPPQRQSRSFESLYPPAGNIFVWPVRSCCWTTLRVQLEHKPHPHRAGVLPEWYRDAGGNKDHTT